MYVTTPQSRAAAAARIGAGAARPRRLVAENDPQLASGTGRCTEFTVTRMAGPTVGGYFNSVGPQRQEVFIAPRRDCAEVRAWRVTGVSPEHTVGCVVHDDTRACQPAHYRLSERRRLSLGRLDVSDDLEIVTHQRERTARPRYRQGVARPCLAHARAAQSWPDTRG